MIKKIIHVSDIHIKNYQRLEEISEVLDNFIKQCAEIAADYERDEVRIVIAGDLLHSKNTITPNLVIYASTFLRQLASIARVILISGNHDTIVSNSDKIDAITSIVDSTMIDDVMFMDEMCGYESGIIVDENITWALYSIYDGFSKPDITKARMENPENTVVGLFHGDIVGSTLPNGMVMEEGLDRDVFSECDCVLAGHIHKRQEIKCGDCTLVYSGSIYQNNYGETVTQHGFCLWDIPSLEHHMVDVPNDYGLYEFKISSLSDIENDKETLSNY